MKIGKPATASLQLVVINNTSLQLVWKKFDQTNNLMYICFNKCKCIY